MNYTWVDIAHQNIVFPPLIFELYSTSNRGYYVVVKKIMYPSIFRCIMTFLFTISSNFIQDLVSSFKNILICV